MISVIIATYYKNIKKLVPTIHKTLSRHEHEIIVVDNSSPDYTVRELVGE